MSEKDKIHWLVGYGTFITRDTWKKHSGCKICRVQGFRRVYDPKMAWFPFAISDEHSEFLALCFPIEGKHLEAYDRYEGVSQNLYERVEIEVLVRHADESWLPKDAWIYLPTSSTMRNPRFPWDDVVDRWLQEEIRKLENIHEEFPEFFASSNGT